MLTIKNQLFKTAITVIVLLFAINYKMNGNQIVLSMSGKIKTLNQAIQIAQPYDTIIIEKGTYASPNTLIEKPLTLIGKDFPKIDGQYKDEVITILSNDVTITGIEVCNSKTGSMKGYAGIRVYRSSNVKLINNRIVNTFFGIYLSDATDILVQKNYLSGALSGTSNGGNGIHLWKCERISIFNNYIQGHRDGIYFEFAKHSLIKNNYSTLNYRYGLHFMFSDNDTYISNTFINNGTGVAVMYTKGVQMYHNTFKDNWGASAYALLLKDISRSIIKGNKFENNTVGITMEGSSKIVMTDNDFIRNGYALKMMANCIEDTVTGNNFSGNTFDMSTNGELQMNLIAKNYWNKYDGYDLNKDGIGDIPYRPVSLYSQITEQMPYTLMLMHSFIVELMDKVEKGIPTIVPENLKDDQPLMKKIKR